MADYDNQNLGSTSSLENSMERIRLLNASSTQIIKAPPERRLLNTSKQEIDEHGNIRRWTFGVKNPPKMVKTILLLGETGTGKSTLINMMTTYILGVEWSDNILYEIVEEEGKDQSKSQTSKVTIYEIFGYEDVRVPFSLRIIDTPGYSDSKRKIAAHIAETLHNLFESEDGVHQIDAVCLVVRASQNRLILQQHCIFDAMISLFGKDINKNIIPIFTFSGEGKPAAFAAVEKFSFPWCRDEKNHLVHFRFDNTPAEDTDEHTSPNYLQEAWEKRKRSMQAFFKYLNNLETKSLVMTHKVLFKREELQCCMQSLQDQIVNAGHLQNEIKQTQEALEKNKKEIEEKNNFEYVVEESFADKVKSDTYATSCQKCTFTCHHPCSFIHDKILWCSVTSFKNCVSCPGKCSLSDHVTEKMRYVPSVRKVTRTYKELKEKYEKLSITLESVQEMLQKDLSKTEEQKKRLTLELYNHVIRLNKIALKPESLFILQNTKLLVENLREIKQDDKIQILEDIRKRAMEAHDIEGDEESLLKIYSTI